MSIGLLNRIRTLLAADAHAVVESLEDRPLLLKQYVREAELELDRKRARLETLAEEEKRLRDEVERREREVRRLDEDVALALEGGKEELARFALRRLLPHREELRRLGVQVQQRVEEQRALEQRLEQQSEQLEGLKTRVRAELVTRVEPREGSWLGDPQVADEEIELELMRRRARAERGAP